MSSLLQRTAGRQKLRLWSEHEHLKGYPTVQIVRRYEENDDFVDLYWFIHLVPGGEANESRFTRCLWSELDESIRKMEEGEVLFAVQDILSDFSPANVAKNQTIKPTEQEAKEVVFVPTTELTTPIQKTSKECLKMPKVAKRQEKLMALIASNPHLTLPEMAHKLKVSRPTITRDIDEMKHEGIIRHVGALKNGHWELITQEDK